MQNDRINTLTIKYIFKTLTKDETLELKEWIDSSNEHQLIFKNLLSLYHVDNQLDFIANFDKEESWRKLRMRCSRKRNIRLLSYYSSAAVIALLIASSFFIQEFSFFDFSKQADKQIAMACSKQHKIENKAILRMLGQPDVHLAYSNWEVNDGIIINGKFMLPQEKTNRTIAQCNTQSLDNSIEVPKGGEYSIVLSDGTKVKMNADSQLKFPLQFGDTRRVELVGEAFFSVTHNEARHFIVKTARCDIEVLGTEFNVSAYPNEPVTVTLINGSVKVTTPQTTKKLPPGEQYVSNQTKTTKVETELYTSWTRGEMEFDAMPLGELITKLSRWYNVELKFTSPEIESKQFTGVLFRNEPLENALELLHKVSDIQFEKRGEIIYIKGN